MRILMLDNEFPPLGGGTGVVNYHLLKELAGYTDVIVDLVTSSRTRAHYEVEHFTQHITIYKVPVDNRNIHHSSNLELLRYAGRGLSLSHKLVKRYHYDLSFAFAGVPAGAMSYALCRLIGLPYIVSLQGPDVPGFEARYNYLYPFLKPLLRVVWQRAAAVTAISAMHQRLAKETTPELAIPIIFNGVETDVFYPADARDRSINLLCVGRLIERKGQQHLLYSFADLLKQLPDRELQLTLVGTGDAEAALKQQARELGIANRVMFLGFVAREDMPEIYRQADVFVLPSQSEGMSIALLEAMASGLPVVVTDTGGTEELVTPEENGLVVDWADVAGLTLALRQLAEDPALCERMGVANRAIALRCSWQAITKQYLNLIALVVQPIARSTPNSAVEERVRADIG